MAISRRQFLKRTGLAAGGIVGSSFLTSPLLRQALANTIGDRYLVVVFLDGGNDGQNTILPLSGSLRTAYNNNRSSINIAPGVLGATTLGNDPGSGTPIALHPAMSSFMTSWNANRLAVIQGCGYPDYNLSHDESRHIWETANPLRTPGVTQGWIGNFLANCYPGTAIPAVNLTSSVSGAFRQPVTGVLTVDRLDSFGFPIDYIGRDFGFYAEEAAENALRQSKFDLLSGFAVGSPIFARDYLGKVGGATLDATQAYPGLHDHYLVSRPTGQAFSDLYDTLDDNTGFSLGNDLREVAKIIYGVKTNFDTDVTARFFEVRNGGYDTHSSQGGATGDHATLLREVADSIDVFRQDLEDMGVWDRTTVVVWSEFSRRIQQNSSGTDHGSQGPVFVIGGDVVGGIYGNHPDIVNDATSGGGAPTGIDDNGNTVFNQIAGPVRSTDFRDVFGTVLKHWLNAPAGVVNGILPADTGDPDYYWTSRNFDMPFLV